MPRFLQYTFAGVILGLLVGVPLTYGLWQGRQYRNFHVVREGVLYRSGQLPLDGLQRLVYDRHIKTVVTLRYPAAQGQPAPDADEEKWCRSQGLHYFRLPYQSWSGREDEGGSVPAEANVRQFLDIMKDPRNYPVLVHCFAGIHRTGAMCAVYRMEFDRWSPEQAMGEMREMGYTAHHQDVFSYLEKYQIRGGVSSSGDASPSFPLIHVADEQPKSDPKTWAQSLFVNGMSKDFGKVARGAQLEHDFIITNSLKDRVWINKVRSGCCVDVNLGKYMLQPGESTNLHVTLESRRFVGPKTCGILVEFGPEPSMSVVLTVKATSETPSQQSALDILLPDSAPHRYSHLAQPGDVVDVDLGPKLPELGARFVVQADGTLNLGKHGSVHVAGQQNLALLIEHHLGSLVGNLSVDLFPGDDRPKTCRVIVKGKAGDQIFTMPWQASQRVREVLGQVPGLVADVVILPAADNTDGCRAWIIRPPVTGKGPSRILPINWDALRRSDVNATNWRIQVGDEIYVDRTGEESEGQRNVAAQPVAVNSRRNRGTQEPDEASILRALKPVYRLPYLHEESRSNFEFVVEKMHSDRDPVTEFSLIGLAQVEHTLWKCTVSYTEHVRILFPFPMRSQSRCQQVLYVDRDALHIMSESDLNPIRVDGVVGR